MEGVFVSGRPEKKLFSTIGRHSGYLRVKDVWGANS